MDRRMVADLVSRAEVVQLAPETSVRTACEVMASEHIGAILVTSGERLDGIFTERDALNRVLAQGIDPETIKLSDVMTTDPMAVAPDNTAIEALRVMRNGGFRHLPVVDGERLVGIISLRDFIGAELSAVDAEIEFQTRIAEGPG